MIRRQPGDFCPRCRPRSQVKQAAVGSSATRLPNTVYRRSVLCSSLGTVSVALLDAIKLSRGIYLFIYFFLNTLFSLNEIVYQSISSLLECGPFTMRAETKRSDQFQPVAYYTTSNVNVERISSLFSSPVLSSCDVIFIAVNRRSKSGEGYEVDGDDSSYNLWKTRFCCCCCCCWEGVDFFFDGV